LKKLLQLSIVLFPILGMAQTKVKNLPAKRTIQKVEIDGKLNEPAWKDAAKFDEMIEFRPTMGKNEEKGNETEAYLMYSDEGIYFGGTCWERSLDSISKELAGRDGFGQNDYIGIIFDTYSDKLNGFEYFLTPLGEQWDAKMSSNQNSNNGGEDFAWNAVWKSKVVLHEKGWTFEMFLPYAAIRFSKDKIQNWGLNITRRKRKTEQQYTWNPIDINVNGFLTQEGQWTGITDIKPPLRLQLFPYFSVYENHYPSSNASISPWTSQVSGGLDLKLGISQSFTLDATLIPDFGQVQSDNRVLNLTPFEVKFNEFRSFFTEGTELFSKGDYFYSRRIGGTPIGLYNVENDLKSNETIRFNPSTSKLINASKISGRTKSGLGVGVLNAITKNQYAIIEDTISGTQRTFLSDPSTNYSVIVLDQNLKNNSSISFINTNVTRSNNYSDANVSSAMVSLFDKKNTYNLNARAALSKINPKNVNEYGYSHAFGIGKTSGRLTYQYDQELTDTKFTSNDLGYFTNNNYINHFAYVGYRYTVPKAWYNRLQYNFNVNFSTLYSKIGDNESKYQSGGIRANMNAQTKKLVWFGIIGNFNPEQNDFYEPRVNGRLYRRGKSVFFGSWLEGNSAKKYYVGAEFFVRKFINFYDAIGYDMSLTQNYRFNSKFSVSHQVALNPRPTGLGFTSTLDERKTILFATRNVKTVENTFNLKYNFTNKMGLTFRSRHYVSQVLNKNFFTLQTDGSLLPYKESLPKGSYNRNVNIFNIDMVYTWQFAPGSFLNAVWKNASFLEGSQADLYYGENFRNIMNSDQNNNFSLKVIYFIDYLTVKGLVKRG
jgi:hypothetical protein